MKKFLNALIFLVLTVNLHADWKIAGDALKASDKTSGDYFGYSVDVGNNYAVVGAPYVSMGGAIYVFKKDENGEWEQMQKIEAINANISPSAQFDSFDTVTLHGFGTDVAISDENTSNTIPFTIVVGAPSTSVYHNVSNITTGAFCVYELNTNLSQPQWQQNDECMQGIVSDTDGSTASALGTSVDVSIWAEGLNKYGGIIVGDPKYDSKHSDVGMVVFFRYNTSLGWRVVNAVVGNGGASASSDINFGQSIAIHKDNVIVGVPGYNIYDPNDDDPNSVMTISKVGAAYFFTSNGEEVNTYTPPHEEREGGHMFGSSVDIYGDYAIVAEQHRTGGTSYAAAYIIKKGVDGNWTQHNYIENNSRGYGYSVAIDDTHAAVSAFNPSANGYVFMYKTDINNDWNNIEPYDIFDIAKRSAYGIDVALYEDELIVGAPLSEEVKQYEYVSDNGINPSIIMYLLN